MRVFSPTDKAVNASLKTFKPIKKAWLTDLDEKRQQELKPAGHVLKFKAAKKKIVTIEFRLCTTLQIAGMRMGKPIAMSLSLTLLAGRIIIRLEHV